MEAQNVAQENGSRSAPAGRATDIVLQRSITIDDVTIHLRAPDDVVDSVWIGQAEVHRLFTAAWLKMHERDRIMTPVTVGSTGCGKTTLACAVARDFGRPVYLVNCTSDMRPEDLLITPVIASQQQILYRASGLVSAMVNGGICILDEANRMSEKSWASLAPLLDDRRYIESIIAGVKIHAHPEFRIAATMNEDASTFNIPEYIESRLKPIIPVEFPGADDLRLIISYHVPYASERLVEQIVRYLMEQKEAGKIGSFSTRDAIQLTRYLYKSPDPAKVPLDTVVPLILKVHEKSLTKKVISLLDL
ncbi:MAG: MoxR family ATPase [Methanomicrobiales archaeon]|nr:MoxR family ATPase [Methanomicrobiales archaeon]